MATRYLVLEVKVFETDENGAVIANHCEHRERYGESWLENKEELFRWAYEGFNVARNGFLDSPGEVE